MYRKGDNSKIAYLCKSSCSLSGIVCPLDLYSCYVNIGCCTIIICTYRSTGSLTVFCTSTPGRRQKPSSLISLAFPLWDTDLCLLDTDISSSLEGSATASQTYLPVTSRMIIWAFGPCVSVSGSSTKATMVVSLKEKYWYFGISSLLSSVATPGPIMVLWIVAGP